MQGPRVESLCEMEGKERELICTECLHGPGMMLGSIKVLSHLTLLTCELEVFTSVVTFTESHNQQD